MGQLCAIAILNPTNGLAFLHVVGLVGVMVGEY